MVEAIVKWLEGGVFVCSRAIDLSDSKYWAVAASSRAEVLIEYDFVILDE